jgi:type II secretory pathway pseudopilin PulG
MHKNPVRRRRGESGFALLLVFAMMSAAAILLYLELPRVVMRAQREKEQLLIDRGEQYQRAIQLFVRKLKQYPQSIDDLEETNNTRFLRRRYKDPFTGEDNWRVVHIDAAGVFTDSLVHKAPDPTEEGREEPQVFVGVLPSIGSPGADANPDQVRNVALQRRGSDRPPVEAGEQPVADPQMGDPEGLTRERPAAADFLNETAAIVPGVAVPAQGEEPAGVPAPPGAGFIGGQPGQPIFNSAGFRRGGANTGVGAQIGAVPPAPGQPSFSPFPGLQGTPGQAQPQGRANQPFIGGAIPPQPTQVPDFSAPAGAAFSAPGAQQPAPLRVPRTPVSQTPQAPQFQPAAGFGGRAAAPAAPGQPGAPSNDALNLIQRILTTPRTAPPGAAGTQQGSAGFGAGIAGVATTHEGEGVKVYNERTLYKEWEFLYDPRQDATSGLQPGIQQQPVEGAGGEAAPGGAGRPAVGPGSPLGGRSGVGGPASVGGQPGPAQQAPRPATPSRTPFIGGAAPAPPEPQPAPKN